MPFKVLSAKEIADRYKQTRASSVSDLPEWAALVEALTKGLKSGEAAAVEFRAKGKQDVPRAKALQQNFKRNAKKYLKKNKLPYSVRAMKDANGVFVVLVEHSKK